MQDHGKKPRSGDGKPQPATGEGWTTATILTWIIVITVLVYFGYRNISMQAVEPLDMSYTALLEQVHAGSIDSVELSGQKIDGTFTRSMRMTDDGRIVSTIDGDGTTTFTSVIPASVEQDFVVLLAERGVAVSVSDDGQSFWFLMIPYALPILIIGALLFVMMRRTSSVAGRTDMYGFGKSKAREYDVTRPGISFADVAGEDEAKKELTQVVDFLKNPAKYHGLGARLPRGILLLGPPGTGKTLLARAVAGEAGVPFFSVSGSEFVEMFVGVGASRVRDLFKRAKETAPAIVFVDELDAVGRQRFAGIGGGNDEREQTLNQILVEMDGFEPKDEVIVLAATNRPDVLDAALLRPGRFDRQVALGLPGRRDRLAILRVHARGKPIAPDVDLDALAAATPGFSGADLANLVNEAALTSALRNEKVIVRDDFETALDKIVLGTARGAVISAEEKAVLAYHEAGHALIAAVTPGADPLRKVSIVPRGQALGVTIQAPAEDRFTYTRAQLADRLSILMGGRVAEQLVFGDVTTGAQNDLKEATSLARKMVGLWGMSNDVGPYFLGLGEQHVFLGREITREGKDVSEDMLNRAERATQSLLEAAMERANVLLIRERGTLDRLADLLIAEETIDAAQIANIVSVPVADADLPILA
jgi:cell division protease FtsH